LLECTHGGPSLRQVLDFAVGFRGRVPCSRTKVRWHR